MNFNEFRKRDKEFNGGVLPVGETTTRRRGPESQRRLTVVLGHTIEIPLLKRAPRLTPRVLTIRTETGRKCTSRRKRGARTRSRSRSSLSDGIVLRSGRRRCRVPATLVQRQMAAVTWANTPGAAGPSTTFATKAACGWWTNRCDGQSTTSLLVETRRRSRARACVSRRNRWDAGETMTTTAKLTVTTDGVKDNTIKNTTDGDGNNIIMWQLH